MRPTFSPAPNLISPQDLVFALRHRFYFDYFLADALISQLETALAATKGEAFVNWCISHHVTDAFVTCLDFLSWDTRITRGGAERLISYFADPSGVESVLASYLSSLALCIILRRGSQGERHIEHLQLAKASDTDIYLVKEFLPKEISEFTIASSSFPQVTLDALDLRDVHFDSCDFQKLRIVGNPSKITKSTFSEVECGEIHLEGNLFFTNTILDIEGTVVVPERARLEFYNCALSPNFHKQLEDARNAGADIGLKNTKIIEPASVAPVPLASQTVGRRFLNRLMSLLRKEGHEEFAVYQFKLRDKTPGTQVQYTRVIDLLQLRGCLEKRGNMFIMTGAGASNMYHPRLIGRPDYDAHDSYWGPIIGELDELLRP